jgi:electron transport complex protein RnfE
MSEERYGPAPADLAAISPDVRQLLVLCPLLAVTDTVVGALGLGVTSILTVAIARLLMSLIGRWLAPEVRWMATILVVAGVLAGIGLVMSAYLQSLTQTVGVFVALLASNILILTSVEADETSAWLAQWKALRTSAGLLLGLVVLGFARELVGRGSLFTGAGRLLGEAYAGLEVAFFRLDMGFLLALLPPGAFIAAGLFIAARRLLRARKVHG